VLILGKPRSGKTTLCKLLAQRLDLLHINIENWLAKLLKKIKEKPEDEPELEEGQVPVKYYTELEEAVSLALKSGEGPS
jgi:adenylate kinase family enzyme